MQGGPALKGSEGYRSVQKHNIREMLNGKEIGGRETSRMLQGMDHLGLVQLSIRKVAFTNSFKSGGWDFTYCQRS